MDLFFRVAPGEQVHAGQSLERVDPETVRTLTGSGHRCAVALESGVSPDAIAVRPEPWLRVLAERTGMRVGVLPPAREVVAFDEGDERGRSWVTGELAYSRNEASE